MQALVTSKTRNIASDTFFVGVGFLLKPEFFHRVESIDNRNASVFFVFFFDIFNYKTKQYKSRDCIVCTSSTGPLKNIEISC